MKKKLLKQLKDKLKQEKKELKETLQSFATEDDKPKGDWDTRYPKFDGGKLEEEADEVNEYDKLLSIEHKLELRLKDVNGALKKIKKEKYGKCEKCKEDISEQRLKAYPAARLCKKCK